jgi:DNA polymerase-3 subunit gamma/tau
MSYQVLARKWRPSNFNEVAGQAHVLKSLVNALNNQRLHHAYLFTGTRGVGKTTLARILAKCLNCEKGIVSTPCGECGSCTEINEGRFIDLIEVDAASRTKVEDTRDLLDNVQYTPARGRFKVYLIDEVHMLSSHSFNALLKTLEEPPPHVKFLFATTDPQKLPVTILSRCLQFNLKNLSPQMIVEYLLGVLESEKIENEERALWQIAASAAGSMRDALTLVDQAISFCQGDITEDGVIEMLGIPEHRQIHSLLLSMASGNVTNVLALISEISEHTPDYSNVLDGLLSILHRIAIAQVVPAAVDNSFGDREQVQELARQISAEDVQLYYQMGIKGREDLNYSPEIRNAFEMLILRMMVFSPSYVHHDNQSLDSTDLDSVSTNEASEQQPIDDSVGRDQSANKVAENVKKKKQLSKP